MDRRGGGTERNFWMQSTADIIMDFTHTYSKDWIEQFPDLHYLDCSDIEGTDMYCTGEAQRELQKRIAAYPIRGVHFIDSGNYHYLTGLFTRQIQEPYNLLFFDNHNDMKPTLIPELISCGAWAKQLLEGDKNLGKLLLIGPSKETIEEIETDNREKLLCVSWEELEAAENAAESQGGLHKLLQDIWEQADTKLPLYLSIDKDVLSEEYACTNWDQGQMSLPLLKEILKDCCWRSRILGADICGELPDSPPGQAVEVRRINEHTNTELYGLLKEYI